MVAGFAPPPGVESDPEWYEQQSDKEYSRQEKEEDDSDIRRAGLSTPIGGESEQPKNSRRGDKHHANQACDITC